MNSTRNIKKIGKWNDKLQDRKIQAIMTLIVSITECSNLIGLNNRYLLHKLTDTEPELSDLTCPITSYLLQDRSN